METFKFGVAFLTWSFASIFWASSIPLAVREITLIIQAVLISFVIINYGSRIFIAWGVVVLGLVESLIGFLQIIFQGSIGWYILGEPHLDILNQEVAKTIVGGGGRLLRAYGTFVHPNVLGAFLTISLLCAIYLILTPHPTKSSSTQKLSLFVGCGVLFFLILGLILTFSRAAWLVSFLTVLFSLFLEWRKNRFSEKLKFLFITLLTSIIFLISIFYYVIFPKLYLSSDEPAITQRVDYIKAGFRALKERPFTGVGIGNQVSGSAQPIHNLYLLIASETGLIGLALFCFFIISIIRNSKFEIAKIVLFAILFLGLFDHYFWTIPAGQLMLWITIFNIIV